MSRLRCLQSFFIAVALSGLFAVPALAAPAREVAFVDGAVVDHEVLVAGVRPGVETVRLDPAGDALAQMAAWAETHSGYEAIHVVSHAAPGAHMMMRTAARPTHARQARMRDGPGAHWDTNPYAMVIEEKVVTGGDTFAVWLAPSGGVAVRFIPMR